MDNLGEEFRQEFMELPEHAVAYNNASMWKRAIALILDVLFLNFIIFSPFQDLLTGFFNQAGLSMQGTIPDYVYASIMCMAFIALLYFSLLQYYQQQTLGMMIVKIYVLPKPGFWKSITRNLFVLPIFPFNLLWIIEPAYLFFKGQRVLEKVTGTDTVEVNYG